MKIGVLALQGAFIEHRHKLTALGVDSFEIRQARDVNAPFDGLILPGGESTVMNKLLRELNLFDPLLALIKDGMPVFGTCAGLILLSESVDGGQPCFATMRVTARRNAYGRQLGSFRARKGFGTLGTVPMTFIRAPYIETAGEGVEILAEVDGKIVAARQGRQLVTAFHPELDDDNTILKYFLTL